ncbi:MAG: Flp family type IVb pilin, partial [Candidatus Limnocylindrales bacterium]
NVARQSRGPAAVWQPALLSTRFPDAPSGSRRQEVMQVAFSRLTTSLRSLVGQDDEGQGLAEYALILALIAIVAIVALLFLGSQISDKLSTVGNAL